MSQATSVAAGVRGRGEVELIDDFTGESSGCGYQVVPMPAAIG